MKQNRYKNPVKGKAILLGVTGSIACYKACEITSQLTQQDANITVVMTRSALEFVNPLSFQTLSRNRVYYDMFDTNYTFDCRHISLAEKCDLIVIAPATANIIGKIANGIADDLLSTTIMSAKKPVIIAPAMNTNMLNNPIVIENINKLKNLGYIFIEPEKGYLACGTVGEGRLADINVIIDKIKQTLKK